MSESVGVNTILTFGALLVGGKLGGVLGAFFAIPLLAVALAVLERVYLHLAHRLPAADGQEQMLADRQQAMASAATPEREQHDECRAQSLLWKASPPSMPLVAALLLTTVVVVALPYVPLTAHAFSLIPLPLADIGRIILIAGCMSWCWITSRYGFTKPKQWAGRLDPGSGACSPQRQPSRGHDQRTRRYPAPKCSFRRSSGAAVRW
jgi:hypothetical protein